MAVPWGSSTEDLSITQTWAFMRGIITGQMLPLWHERIAARRLSGPWEEKRRGSRLRQDSSRLAKRGPYGRGRKIRRRDWCQTWQDRPWICRWERLPAKAGAADDRR